MGRILLLVIGLVVAFGLGASVQQPTTSTNENPKPGQITSVRAAEPERRGEKVSQDQAKADPTDLERSDLYAQQAMALFAALQVLLTFLGLVYIRWTLKETRNAVTEAANATNAARDAVQVTQEIGEAQVRAYLHISEAALNIGRGNLQLEFRVRNSGQSPARKVGVICRFAVSTMENEIVAIDPAGILQTGWNALEVPAGGEDRLAWGSTDEMASHLTVFGTRALLAVSRLTYEDVFGKIVQRDQYWSVLVTNGGVGKPKVVEVSAEFASFRKWDEENPA